MPRSQNVREVGLPSKVYADLQAEADRKGITTTSAALMAVLEWLDRQRARHEAPSSGKE